MAKHTKTDNVVKFKARKHHDHKERSFKQKLGLNMLTVVLAIIVLLGASYGIAQIKISKSGFTDKDALISAYFTSLNDADKDAMSKCFYPSEASSMEEITTQITYAQNEKDQNVTWNPSKITTEWSEMDVKDVQSGITTTTVDEAQKGIAFIPFDQITSDNVTVHQEDVYQFIIYRSGQKWYIAAFMQNSRNVTGATNTDGTDMTEEELSDWLYSLAQEIGSDKVGYLYVDNYWHEIIDETGDDQIKTYVTSDGSSYMTMAVINDSDIKDFGTYAESIIKSSDKEYGDIATSDGVIGEYKTTVKIAQNEDTGAKVIIWIFKTGDDEKVTHVITLESTTTYDASTYINTFHLEPRPTENVNDASAGTSTEE